MDISQIKQQLMDRQAVLEARADKTARDASHQDEAVPADFAEQATARENDDVLRAIADESVNEINLIKAALARIEAGTYGECSACGEDIAAERLAAVPYTTLCVKCASTQAQ